MGDAEARQQWLRREVLEPWQWAALSVGFIPGCSRNDYLLQWELTRKHQLTEWSNEWLNLCKKFSERTKKIEAAIDEGNIVLGEQQKGTLTSSSQVVWAGKGEPLTDEIGETTGDILGPWIPLASFITWALHEGIELPQDMKELRMGMSRAQIVSKYGGVIPQLHDALDKPKQEYKRPDCRVCRKSVGEAAGLNGQTRGHWDEYSLVLWFHHLNKFDKPKQVRSKPVPKRKSKGKQ